MTETTNGAFPIVPYRDPRAALSWLEDVLGAHILTAHPPDPAEPLVHAEVRVGTGIVMLNNAERAEDSPFKPAGPVIVYVVVDDPDSLYTRAAAAGAEIVMGLTDQPYGSCEFALRDTDGNVWSFGTYRPGADEG